MPRLGSPRAKPPAVHPPRHTSSKYDFVKVKVWLGQGSTHYYVLSRFLVSRMLTVTRIPAVVAIKIALELKKLLVDASLLDVSQADLEHNLFVLMRRRGYGEEYINRYKMMTRFHHQRVPLIILICGTACVGKSTIATQLAQRLNLPNVLQTDIVYELLRTSVDAPLSRTPVWARDFDSPEDLIAEFCRECRIVHKGLEGDLGKAIRDGKPIIIEGEHLDPSLFLLARHDGALNTKAEDTRTAHDHQTDVTLSQPVLTDSDTGISVDVAHAEGHQPTGGMRGCHDVLPPNESFSEVTETWHNDTVKDNPPSFSESGTSQETGKALHCFETLCAASHEPTHKISDQTNADSKGQVHEQAREYMNRGEVGSSSHTCEGSEPTVIEELSSTAVSSSESCVSKGGSNIQTSDFSSLLDQRSGIVSSEQRHWESQGPTWMEVAKRLDGTGEGRRQNWTGSKEEESFQRIASGPPAGAGADDEPGLKSGAKKRADPIVVPVVLKMDEDDHLTLLAEWRSCHEVDGDEPLEVDDRTLLKRLQVIQEYLCSLEGQGVAVVNVSATTFTKGLDWLHAFLLQKIEQGCAPAGH